MNRLGERVTQRLLANTRSHTLIIMSTSKIITITMFITPTFCADKNALQIVVYYDELEVTNPLGSYVSKQVGLCIFFIANIRLHFQSTHTSTYLVAVGKSEDIGHYRIHKFLSPFIDHLKILYLDGIVLYIM